MAAARVIARMVPSKATTDDQMKTHAHDLASYWTGIHKALEGRLSSVREYLRHPSSGVNAENYFRQLLADYLPKRFAVDSGFVVNTDGDRSDFIDVVIVDTLNIAPLSAEPYFKVFPAEAVVGAIEITSAPRSRVKRKGIANTIPKMADDALKLAGLRQVAREREYHVNVPDIWSSPSGFVDRPLRYSLSPRCFLVTFGDEWSSHETYLRKLLEALRLAKRHSKHVWINAALSLKHGMYHFRPYTDFTANHIKDNPLLEFVLYLNNAYFSLRRGIDVDQLPFQ